MGKYKVGFSVFVWAIFFSSLFGCPEFPNMDTVGRGAPIILTVEGVFEEQYAVFNKHTYEVARTYRVKSIKKNIIRDVGIETGDQITLHYRNEFYIGERPIVDYIKFLQSLDDEREQPRELIVFVSVDKEGRWISSIPQRHLSLSHVLEHHTQNTFAPVGIDGAPADYSLAEWRALAGGGVYSSYYGLDFIADRPDYWPSSEAEAVDLACTYLRSKNCIKMFDGSILNDFFNKIGISRESSMKNKLLLQDLGRVGPHEACIRVEELVLEKCAKDSHIQVFVALKETEISHLEFNDEPVSEAVEWLLDQTQNRQPIRIEVSKEVESLFCNIRPRNLSAVRCLNFILQQANCSLEFCFVDDEQYYLRIDTIRD